MPRLLHMADVHVGARHHDLGEAAAAQRERQFAAFARAIELALAERVDLVLVAGDLFDSNTQPRRSVERVAGELKRLAAAGVRGVIIPGTHDCYDESSIYRTYDLAALAGEKADSDAIVILTPDRPEVVYTDLDLAVVARVFPTKRASASPLAGLPAPSKPTTWRVGMVHGSLRISGKVEQDEVIFDEAEVGASGLDYLALGHWHSFSQGRVGSTTWAYSGAPEPVAVDQDGAGQVLLVTLTQEGGQRQVALEARQVGRTRFSRIDLDASEVGSQDGLVRRMQELADPDLVLEARLIGVEPDTLDLHEDEIHRQLSPHFLRFRFRDLSVPPPLEGPLPSAETIEGAFIRDLEGRIAAAEAAGDAGGAAELRESLRLGRLLLEDPTRVTLV
ncbi:MAG TPA: DNA repair exonuclease [Candidatus Limnocylindrales bacterium]|nr:DNA repair exonuclease [Candidatus Limnocylindrales bacterium]